MKMLSSTLLGIIFAFLLAAMFLFPVGAFYLLTTGVGIRPQAWVAYGVFVIFVAYAWMTLNKRYLREHGFLKTTAAITDAVEASAIGDSEGRRVFSPVVQFLDKDGNLITAVCKYVMKDGGWRDKRSVAISKMGKTLDIFYDPNNPTVDVRANTFLQNVGFFLGLAIVGGSISLYAILYIFGATQ